MAEKVVMLALSPTMETGTIVKWMKREGDGVQSGEVLCHVETDKATMEYESVNEGVLLKIAVPEGKEAKVGQTIAVVGEKGEDISELLDEIETEAEAAAGRLPGEEEAAVVSGRLPGEEEATVVAGRPPGEEVAAVVAGRLPGEEEAAAREPEGGAQLEEVQGARLPGGVRASPMARHLAGHHSIDLRLIRGSGPGGRIVKRDVESLLEGHPAKPVVTKAATPKPQVAAVGVESVAGALPVLQRVPVSGMRKAIARRLAEAKFSAPHYYLKTAVNVESLLEARKGINARLKDEKLSFNAFLIKFAAEALRRHPMVNAGWQGDAILQFGRADIGLAVALPDGLIAPIVRDCWNKGIVQIDSELRTLVDRALSKKLRPEEYTGATFTISNLGSYGIQEFTAIINPPGSAILAVGEAKRQPAVGEDERIVVRTTMALTLSCDHRVIDGAVGALFLKELQGMIENPVTALL